MGRSPCCAKEGLNRGAWTALEDKTLSDYIKLHGEGGWRNLPNKAGLKRCGKSCRLRWLNYLRPDIKRGNISPDEEELILRLHNLLGNRWSLIAGRLPGRTDNEIKNYWNTTLSKRVHQDQKSPKLRSSPSSDGGHGKPEPKPKKATKDDNVVTATSHNVVRTKASKCTKVFITTQLPNKGLFQLDDHRHHHNKVAAMEHHNQNQNRPDDNGLSSSSTSPSMLENSLSSSSSDYFLMDFGVMNSDLCLTNLLGDDHLIFSEEMRHYWSGKDHVGGSGEDDLDQLHANTVMNFQSLTCCLDGDADQEDWLQLDQ